MAGFGHEKGRRPREELRPFEVVSLRAVIAVPGCTALTA